MASADSPTAAADLATTAVPSGFNPAIFESGDPDFAARLAAAEQGGPTREAIIREALRLFAEDGYRATSLRDLATAVGIKAGSLYNHLSSKHELLSDMVLFGVGELLHGVSGLIAAVPESDSLEQLRVGTRAHVLFYCLHRDQVRVLDREHNLLVGDDRIKNLAMRAEYEGLFRRIIDTGVERMVFREHDAAISVKALLGLGDRAAIWFRPDGRLSATEIADIHADIMVRALVEPALYVELFKPSKRRTAAK